MSEELLSLLASMDNSEQIEKLLRESKNVIYHPQESVARTDGSGQQSEIHNQILPNRNTTYDLNDLYDKYLENNSANSPTTIGQYKRVLPHFIEFVHERDVYQTLSLHSDLIDDYVTVLKEEFKSDSTALTYTKNVRTWLDWLQTRKKCDAGLKELLNRKNLPLNPRVRDVALSLEEAGCILPNLRQQEFGTAVHSITELGYNAGPRLGGSIHWIYVISIHPTRF